MEANIVQPAISGDGNVAPVERGGRAVATLRSLFLLALLVAMFLFVPLLQDFQLAAGQDIPMKDDPARIADGLASSEALRLSQQH